MTTPLLLSLAALAPQDWSAIVSPPKGNWPEPVETEAWSDDLPAALAEAERGNHPLFVVVRCLPCKQCAEFDADVLEGGEELSPLLERFVTVRLTDAMAIDFGILPADGFQDFDLSWWGYFLSPQAELYGIFGGRDEVSDTTRVSVPALANTLRRVLDHHSDSRRRAWKIDRTAPAPSDGPRAPSGLPGYASWKQKHAIEGQACLHCHELGDVLRQPAIDAGDYDKRSALDVWPLPENVGLTLDRDHGLLVTEVAASSPAAAIGVRAGDVLAAAGTHKLFGQADLRGVLHREANPAGSIELRWSRGDELMNGTLELAAGWRRTDLSWRMTASQGNYGAAPGFAWPLRGKRTGIPEGAMAIEPWFGRGGDKGIAWAAGLRPDHTIVAVGGERPDLHGRAFLVWFRARYEPGDEVRLTVRERDGSEKEIRYRL